MSAFSMEIVDNHVVFVPNSNLNVSVNIKDFTIKKALAFFKEVLAYYEKGDKGNYIRLREGFPAWKVNDTGGEQTFVIDIKPNFQCLIALSFTPKEMLGYMKRMVSWLNVEVENEEINRERNVSITG
jgi:hypothetical protein